MSIAFVTGALGFIGSALIQALQASGHEVHALVRRGRESRTLPSGIVSHQGDLLDISSLWSALDAARPDWIFHLAVQGVTPGLRNAWQICETNIMGTVNLLEATDSIDYTRFVYLGGGSEYGAKPCAIREQESPEPKTIYGASKLAATTLCLYAARSHNKPITVLRPFSVYGPGERASRLIPSVIAHILRNEPIPLAAAETRRDFVYLDDVTAACLLAAESAQAPGQIFNIGTGIEYSNAEVVDTLQDLCGSSLPVVAGAFPPRPSDTAHLLADNTLARTVLGWNPAHDLRSGLAKTIDWYRQWM